MGESMREVASTVRLELWGLVGGVPVKSAGLASRRWWRAAWLHL